MTSYSKRKLSAALQNYHLAMDYFDEVTRSAATTYERTDAQPFSEKPKLVQQYLKFLQNAAVIDNGSRGKLDKLQKTYEKKVLKVKTAGKKTEFENELELKQADELDNATRKMLQLIEKVKKAWS